MPGTAGVEPKRAPQLVRRYGTLDRVLEAYLFQTQAEMLRLYRLIATMDAAAPWPLLADQETIKEGATTREAFTHLLESVAIEFTREDLPRGCMSRYRVRIRGPIARPSAT